MEILLTGGTGYIGGAVLVRLLASGHEVTAVVRSDSSAEKVRAAGATPLVGDLFDSDWVRKQLETVQGAVHTAAGSDEKDAALNTSVVDAAIAAFGGTEKRFVHTGGIWTYGSSDSITEDSPAQPIPLTQWRVEIDEHLLASDVHASVVQPGLVYGKGTGIPALLSGGPRDDDGALHLIGTGDQHWTTVHVDDVADLYLRLLESDPLVADGAWVGVSGDNPTVTELGQSLAGSVVPSTAEEAAARFGAPFAEALLLDQQASGAKARTLGWEPSRPSLVELFGRGYPETD